MLLKYVNKNNDDSIYRKEKYYSNEVSLKLIDLLLHKDKVVKQTLTERETEILKLITRLNLSAKQLLAGENT